MLVDITTPEAPEATTRLDPNGTPEDTGDRPTRRRVLGLLATAGATATAAVLTDPLVDRLGAGPSRLDPARALHVTVERVTTATDRAAGDAGHAGHDAPTGGAAGAPTDALGARVWSRLVTVTLVVRNTAATDVLFSPGQVRLRLADGTSVMPVDSERPAGALAGRTSTRTWVRYLAPQDAGALSVDLLPAGATDPVPLLLPGHEHGAAR